MAKAGGGNAGQNKFGNAGMKIHGVYRFNPNPTRCDHAGCQIHAQSMRDKAVHQARIKKG